MINMRLPSSMPRRRTRGTPLIMLAASGTLWTIAGCAGVGAFIDFYIGKRGQQRVKSWLETWWLRFSYINARNFGREEALFAVAVIDRLLGRGIFSIMRIVLFVVLIGVDVWFRLGLGAPEAKLGLGISIFEFYISEWDLIPLAILSALVLVSFLVIFLLFSFSITLTRFASARVIRVVTQLPSLGGGVFFFLLLFQYAMTVFWIWVAISTIRLKSGDNNVVFAFSRIVLLNGLTSIGSQGIFINVGRLALAALFAVSYLLKPLHSTISTLWLRVVESDKPIFTLLFGGAAALAQGIGGIVKSLG